jgi:hypothetical protein
MAEPIIEAEPIDMAEIGENAGELSADVLDTIAELDSESVEPEQFEALQEKLENQITETNEKIAESIGIDEPIDSNMIEDASLEDPTTESGKRLKQFSEEFQTKLKASVESIKAENGESNLDITEAKKTQQSIFEKYGDTILKLSLVIGAAVGGLILLKNLGKELSGCYRTLLCSDSVTTPEKVGCPQENCNCSNINKCNLAACNSKSDSCPSYYWNNVSALGALSMIPNAIMKGVLAPVDKASTNMIKTLAIYGSIFIVFVVIAYFTYRFAVKQNKI